MKLIDYYDKEINYFLRESVKFAQKYDEQAKALNLEDAQHQDPYTERLIEAFAFLTANIKQKLDDGFIDLAYQLLEIISPHYLYPIPSCVILEFKPDLSFVNESVIEKGTPIETKSTNPTCSFQTCSSLKIRPIDIQSIQQVQINARNVIKILLSTKKYKVDWNKFSKDPLTVFINGSHQSVYNLYELLILDIEYVIIRWTKMNGETAEKQLPSEKIIQSIVENPDRDYSLLQYPDNSFSGYRLIEDYFFFARKFFFFEMDVLSITNEIKDDSDIELSLVSTGNKQWDIEIDKNTLKLNCIPAINIFEQKHGSVSFEHDDSELYHKIEVDYAYSNYILPHHITDVTGLCIEDGKRYNYYPLSSYKHQTTDNSDSYFHTKQNINIDNKFELFIGIVRSPERKTESISVKLMCFNDETLLEQIPMGDICSTTTPDFPDNVTVKNITKPEKPLFTQLNSQDLWALINTLSLNYFSLKNIDQLKNMLLLYNRRQTYANKKKIMSIESIYINTCRQLIKGYPVTGLSIDIVLNSKIFTSKGEMLLFAQVLSRLLSMYVPINTFCNCIISEKDGEKLWEMEIPGKKIIL